MGRVPIAAGWVRDEEENILMKCVWQRGYRRPDGAEVLRTVWLCEGNGGFSVRVEEVDAGGQRILRRTDPVQEEKLMDAIREATRIARALPRIASSLLDWTSHAGAKSFDLRIGTVQLYGHLGERHEAPRISFVIQPIKLALDLDDWEAVEALARALGV
jgi:hypothetical protein